jgi:hypothetical protein
MADAPASGRLRLGAAVRRSEGGAGALGERLNGGGGRGEPVLEHGSRVVSA